MISVYFRSDRHGFIVVVNDYDVLVTVFSHPKITRIFLYNRAGVRCGENSDKIAVKRETVCR